jgi:hypothetical protein
MYSSAKDDSLYQKNPLPSKPSNFKLKSWTETVQGYINEANQLTCCILRNRRLMKRPYTWHLTVNIEVKMPPKDITGLWAKVCRKLKAKGIEALWVREPTRSGKVHYHLLLKNSIGKTALERTLKECMPPRKEVGWHKRIQPVKDDWQLAHYITKAKIVGYVKGQSVADYYQRKRLLFKAKLKIKKFGTIGSFWEKPKKEIWAGIKAVEKKIGEGLGDYRVRKVVKHIRKLLGDDVPTSRIERSYGYFANEQNIRAWLETINSTDDR